MNDRFGNQNLKNKTIKKPYKTKMSEKNAIEEKVENGWEKEKGKGDFAYLR